MLRARNISPGLFVCKITALKEGLDMRKIIDMILNRVKSIATSLLALASRKRSGYKVEVYVHFVGNGSWDKVRSKSVTVDTPNFNINVFSSLSFSSRLKRKGHDYVFEDCLRESFVRRGKQVIVVHARYMLDLESANFREFIQKVSPADFAKAG